MNGRMRKTLMVFLSVALCAVPAIAQDTAPGTAILFITSAPIRAEVVVDGNPVGSTPLLLRRVTEGEHSVAIIRPGYYREEQLVVISPGEVASVSAVLRPDTFVTSFSAGQTIVNGQTYSRLDSRFVLPSGTYTIAGDGSALSLEPIYPHQAAIVALQIVTPVLAAISIVATLEDVWLQDKDTSLPTPATIASWTATAIGGGMLLALYGDRAKYSEHAVITQFAEALTASEAETFFVAAEDALGAGNLTSALAGYSRVVAFGGESEYLPLALYKASRIYRVLDQSDLALGGFEFLVDAYPVIEFYDASLKAMADIYVERGQYDLALDTIKRMVFTDPLYPRDEIDELILEIESLRDKPSSTQRDSELASDRLPERATDTGTGDADGDGQEGGTQ